MYMDYAEIGKGIVEKRKKFCMTQEEAEDKQTVARNFIGWLGEQW